MDAISIKGTADAGGSATTLSNATMVWCAAGGTGSITITLDGSVTNGSGNSGSLVIPSGNALLVRKAPADTIQISSGSNGSLTSVSYSSNSMGTYPA
tara:strand:- start:57 stop:347 length:291 start_codon:yes stop_codon:yes gene_type:complete